MLFYEIIFVCMGAVNGKLTCAQSSLEWYSVILLTYSVTRVLTLALWACTHMHVSIIYLLSLEKATKTG